jgi:PncC family amidohydrolase
MWNEINKQSQDLLKICKLKKIYLTTAESCTGGMIASSIVSINGSSSIFKSGIVTYSNESKVDFLKIPLELININGAVSEVVAFQMAENVLSIMNSSLSIAVTGIAGPSGGSNDKPVGLVWIGIGTKKNILTKKYLFQGNRLNVRQQTTLEALKLAYDVVND